MGYQTVITGISPAKQSLIFGNFDANTAIIEQCFNVIITSKVSGITVSGDEKNVNGAAAVIQKLLLLCKDDTPVSEQNVRYITDMVLSGDDTLTDDFDNECVCISAKGKPIKAKTVGQKNYVAAIRKNTVTIGIGPAGTGKTFLAVAMAVTALKTKQVNKIILTRPAVEAGERLGFLPGDLQSKIDPYLRPLYDALQELLDAEGFNRSLEKGIIEIAPLAYMRGRTLNDSFIILDEAQNTTAEQMKMFLTRLGFGSKIVVTGDITQIDLPRGVKSGLAQAAEILEGIDGISIFKLSDKDIVRHSLVQKIINAYEKHSVTNENKKDVDEGESK